MNSLENPKIYNISNTEPDEYLVFDIPYNNILSCEMNLASNADSKLTIVDTTDLFFLSLYSHFNAIKYAAQVQVKINFGWNTFGSSPLLKSDLKPTRECSRIFSLMGCDMSVEGGKSTFVLTLKLSETSMDPWINQAFKPSKMLGNKPLTTFALCKEIDLLFNLLYNTNFEKLEVAKTVVEENLNEKNKNYIALLAANLTDKKTIYIFKKIKEAGYTFEDLQKPAAGGELSIKEFIDIRIDTLNNSGDKERETVIGRMKDITFDSYVNQDTKGYTIEKNDTNFNFKNVPTKIATKLTDYPLNPLECFYFLCKQMKIHNDELNKLEGNTKKIDLHFFNVLEDNQLYYLKGEEVLKTEKGEDGKEKVFKNVIYVKDLKAEDNDSWTNLLKASAEKVAICLGGKEKDKDREIGKVSVKEITISKTGRWKEDVENAINLITNLNLQILQNIINDKKIGSASSSYNDFITKCIRALRNFRNNSEFYTIKIIILEPDFSLSEKNNLANTGSALSNIATKLIKSESDPIIQTYSINPYKKIGSQMMMSQGNETLKDQLFFDVISFKPTITNFIAGIDMASKISQAKIMNPSDGSMSVITGYNDQTDAFRYDHFAPLNTLINYSSPIFTSSANYGNEFANVIHAKNKVTSDLVNKFNHISAELVILGEPALCFSDYYVNKYIFIQSFSNNDGTYTQFTGIYRIKEIKTTITGGKFTTTLMLQKDEKNYNNSNLLFNDLTKQITIGNTITTGSEEQKKVKEEERKEAQGVVNEKKISSDDILKAAKAKATVEAEAKKTRDAADKAAASAAAKAKAELDRKAKIETAEPNKESNVINNTNTLKINKNVKPIKIEKSPAQKRYDSLKKSKEPIITIS